MIPSYFFFHKEHPIFQRGSTSVAAATDFSPLSVILYAFSCDEIFFDPLPFPTSAVLFFFLSRNSDSEMSFKEYLRVCLFLCLSDKTWYFMSG